MSKLVGTWYIKQYAINGYLNGALVQTETSKDGEFSADNYLQFNSDGTGVESVQNASTVFTQKSSFGFRVSGSNITFSRRVALLFGDSCTYTMPAKDQLIFHDERHEPAPGLIVEKEDVYLSK